jgi:hypothetical protein
MLSLSEKKRKVCQKVAPSSNQTDTPGAERSHEKAGDLLKSRAVIDAAASKYIKQWKMNCSQKTA